MSSSLLHYREWQGQYHRPIWAVLPICRGALAMLLRRRLFWALYAFGLLLFLMFFFGTVLLDWLESQVPAAPVQVGNFKTDPDRIVKLVRQGLRVLNGSQDTFAVFFTYQGTMVMVMLALTGAVLVGNDFTHRSLAFYLAKPMSRWHYIAGKCLAVGVVVNLLTTVPAVLLFFQHASGDINYLTDPDFFRDGSGRGPAGLPLLAGILGFGLVLTVFLSILLVAAASWLRRTMPLIMLWSTLFLFFRLLAAILVDGLRYDPRWRLIDLWNDLCLVGFTFLGFEEGAMPLPLPQPQMFEAAIVLGGLCLSCLTYLSLRTRAVEVVR